MLALTSWIEAVEESTDPCSSPTLRATSSIEDPISRIDDEASSVTVDRLSTSRLMPRIEALMSAISDAVSSTAASCASDACSICAMPQLEALGQLRHPLAGLVEAAGDAAERFREAVGERARRCEIRPSARCRRGRRRRLRRVARACGGRRRAERARAAPAASSPNAPSSAAAAVKPAASSGLRLA